MCVPIIHSVFPVPCSLSIPLYMRCLVFLAGGGLLLNPHGEGLGSKATTNVYICVRRVRHHIPMKHKCSQCSLFISVLLMCSHLFPVFLISPPVCPTKTVSIVYSVPSSQCVPNCVLCSLCVLHFSLFSQCVPCVFPIVYSVPSSYCSQYVSSVSPL